jgi:hypothetical protein
MKIVYSDPFLNSRFASEKRAGDLVTWISGLTMNGHKVTVHCDGAKHVFCSNEHAHTDWQCEMRALGKRLHEFEDVQVRLEVWNSTLTWSSQDDQVIIEGKRTSIVDFWGRNYLFRAGVKQEKVEVSDTSTPWLPWWETMRDFQRRTMLAYASVEGLDEAVAYLTNGHLEGGASNEVLACFTPGHDPAEAREEAQKICQEEARRLEKKLRQEKNDLLSDGGDNGPLNLMVKEADLRRLKLTDEDVM